MDGWKAGMGGKREERRVERVTQDGKEVAGGQEEETQEEEKVEGEEKGGYVTRRENRREVAEKEGYIYNKTIRVIHVH